MYDEDTFNRHIFWMKFKRVFLLIFFSIIGCIIGIFLSAYLIELLFLPENIRIPIIAGFTLIFFFITLSSTAKISKDIQDGYWKIAVLRKLTLISKKLDSLDSLQKLENLDSLKNIDLNVSETLSEVKKKTEKKPIKFKKVSKNSKVTKELEKNIEIENND